jgi:hypothetical protein
LAGPDALFDDIEKLAPNNPIQNCARPRLVLIVESLLNDPPAGFPVVETEESKTIEDELFAHVEPRFDVPGEDLESRKTCPSKIPWRLRWDRQGPA